MKKLFIAMSIVAFGFASCGDASEEASGDEKKAGNAEDICKCLDAAFNEKDAQACAPGKSMEELEAMYKDCQGSDDSNDGDDMDMDADMDMDMDMDDMDMDMDMDMEDAMMDAEKSMEDAMKDAEKAMQDAMDGM